MKHSAYMAILNVLLIGAAAWMVPASASSGLYLSHSFSEVSPTPFIGGVAAPSVFDGLVDAQMSSENIELAGSFGNSYFGFPGINGRKKKNTGSRGYGRNGNGYGSQYFGVGGCGQRYFGFSQFGGGGPSGFRVSSRRGGKGGCGY